MELIINYKKVGKTQYERNFATLKVPFKELTGKDWSDDIGAYLAYLNGLYLDSIIKTVADTKGTLTLRMDILEAKIDNSK